MNRGNKPSSIFSFAFLLILLLIMLLASIPVKAKDTALFSASGIFVGVERKIKIINNGYIMINDTFLLSPSNKSLTDSTLALNDFLVGFPKEYSNNLIYYSAHNNEGKLPMAIAKSNKDFQWLKISFPKPIRLGNIKEYNFTVTYVLSDLIKRKIGTKDMFHADFPLYPSLMYNVDYCNVTLTLPLNVKVSQEDFPRDIFVNKTEAFRVLNNFTSPLQAYSNVSSWVEFSSSSFPLLKILELRRDISIDSLGKIVVTDIYEIVMFNVDIVTFILPPNATDVTAYDAYEKYPQYRVWVTEQKSITTVKVTLGEKLKDSERGKIAITYTLPSQKYIIRSGWQNFLLEINLTKPDEWIVRRIIVTVTLPEGANFVQGQENLEIEKLDFLQERASLKYYNVTRFQSLGILSASYQYMPFWAAFRPTILAGAIIGFVSLILFLTRSAGRVEVVTPTPVSLETIRKFVEAYEEKMHILSDIDYLEQQLRRRKISRRKYRFQRRTLDERLSAIQRTIINLQRELETAGDRYVNLMRRLEAVSTDIEAINRSMANVENRYRRRELSAEAYNQLIREYKRRKEEDESIIDEILLRLKEEI